MIGESDPDGCAACSARVFPAERLSQRHIVRELHGGILCTRLCPGCAKRGVNFEGALTWAFEFEDQPWFDGFRQLGHERRRLCPCISVFRMFGKMGGAAGR